MLLLHSNIYSSDRNHANHHQKEDLRYLKPGIFTPGSFPKSSKNNVNYFNLSEGCLIPRAFDILLHFEWEAMVGEYICILKSQSASNGVSHLRKPPSIHFTNPQNLFANPSQIFSNPQKYICKSTKKYISADPQL